MDDQKTCRLLALAEQKFGALSELEREILEAVAHGKTADYGGDCADHVQAENARNSGDKPSLESDRITWLCTECQATKLVSHSGIWLSGLRIDNKLELPFARIPFPLSLKNCAFPDGIDLHDAELSALYLSGTRTGPVSAGGLKVSHDLYMDDGFKAEGEVCLRGADIGGDLVCHNASFLNSGGDALWADNMRVGGSAFLSDGFLSGGQVRLVGARIAGNLECDGGHFQSNTGSRTSLDGERLFVEGHVFLRDGFEARGEVRLLGATIGQSLDCTNGHFNNPQGAALFADGLKASDVNLGNGFCAQGEVRLPGAIINGNLECEGGAFMNPDEVALSADAIKIEQNLFASRGFHAEGELRLSGASIGGQVDFSGAEVVSKKSNAISGEDMAVGGSMFLSDGFKSQGVVSLNGASIGRTLECNNAQLINPKGSALAADRINVRACIHMYSGFKAEGEVCFRGARIGGNLNCDEAIMINPQGRALDGGGMMVQGYVSLSSGFRAEGEVHLASARICGYLDCCSGHFSDHSEEPRALFADALDVGGGVFLSSGFNAEGGVRLLGAKIGGNLECDGGQFTNSGCALDAEAAKVDGYVFLRDGFKASGEVSLVVARIGHSLECTNAQFIGDDEQGTALKATDLEVKNNALLSKGFKARGKIDLAGATIGGSFVWKDVDSPSGLTLDLRGARLGTLLDDPASWPEQNKLFLHGLVYTEIDDTAPTDAKTRIEWLRLQPTDLFRPQPYEQLAAVLRKQGQSASAKKVLIAKAKDRARLTQLTWAEKCWYSFFGKFIGYGYRPWRAFWIGLIVILIGWVVFGYANSSDIMSPTQEGAYSHGNANASKQTIDQNYPKFDPLWYSVDMFVPVVTFYQASYWQPDPDRGVVVQIGSSVVRTGELFHCYLMLHIVMGWVLTTLLIAGLTGLSRG